MNATVRPWGNSHGIRIPKVLLDKIGIKENDNLTLTATEDSIILKKAEKPAHMPLKQRLEAFYGLPLERITPQMSEEEIATGQPVGDEVW